MLHDLVQFGSITPEGSEILKIIGRVRCNVLISGGTGSGKTTLLNCLTATSMPRSAWSPARTPPSCSSSSPTW
jgi:Flp pilus assembly CpaF family ATPase